MSSPSLSAVFQTCLLTLLQPSTKHLRPHQCRSSPRRRSACMLRGRCLLWVISRRTLPMRSEPIRNSEPLGMLCESCRSCEGLPYSSDSCASEWCPQSMQPRRPGKLLYPHPASHWLATFRTRSYSYVVRYQGHDLRPYSTNPSPPPPHIKMLIPNHSKALGRAGHTPAGARIAPGASSRVDMTGATAKKSWAHAKRGLKPHEF